MASQAQIEQRRKASTKRRNKATTPNGPELRNYPAATRPKPKKPQAPISMEFVDGRWMIARLAGPIPASPWEIDLWFELEEARAEIVRLVQRLEKQERALQAIGVTK